MSYEQIMKNAKILFAQAPFIAHIKNEEGYKNALALMDELLEEYDQNRALIEILSLSIERWENSAKEFSTFNKKVNSLNSSLEVLKVLMEQYQLGVDDLPEIGSKSLVSKIMNGHRRLTIDHVQALSKRFSVDPSLFI